MIVLVHHAQARYALTCISSTKSLSRASGSIFPSQDSLSQSATCRRAELKSTLSTIIASAVADSGPTKIANRNKADLYYRFSKRLLNTNSGAINAE